MPRPGTRAESAFAEYLARRASGEDVSFESFCDERPSLAMELRRLYARALRAEWERGATRGGDGGRGSGDDPGPEIPPGR